jgi:putative transposase
VYGYRKVRDDMRELGESCGKNRVHRLMKAMSLRAQIGYGRRPGRKGGRPAITAPHHVQQQFNVAEPNKVWVTDITYIRTYEGWLYLSVVLDLFSRNVIGWSMGSRIDRTLAPDALHIWLCGVVSTQSEWWFIPIRVASSAATIGVTFWTLTTSNPA